MSADKEYMRFYQKETNFYRSGSLSIGRERIKDKNVDYYVVKMGSEIVHEWFGVLGSAFREKKNTGGKKPYVMLMSEKLSELLKEKRVTIEQIGCLTMLSQNIEWGTGRIVQKRSKKPLRAKDIQELLGISHNTLDKIISDLKQNELISVKSDGYYISTDLFKRGSKK